MRFSLRTVSLLSLAALALPVIAGAAAKVTLRDVTAIVQSNTKPLAFDMSAKGAYGKMSATIGVKGVQNGDMKTLSTAAAEATVIFDATTDAQTKGHAEFRGILTKKNTLPTTRKRQSHG